MPYIDKLEKKWGHLAIPNLILILAAFQAVVFVMLKLQPDFANFLVMSRGEVMSGQLWRLITWMFIPRSNSMLYIIFEVMILCYIGKGLDDKWGAFKTNLYVYAGILCTVIGAFVFNIPTASINLYFSLFFAFALCYPNEQILLFFIIPVRIKFIAMVLGAFLLIQALGSIWGFLYLVVCLAHFLTFGFHHLKELRRGGRAGASSVFAPQQRVDNESESSSFHLCHTCGATELTHAKLEFRIKSDDLEYCSECLKKETTAKS